MELTEKVQVFNTDCTDYMKDIPDGYFDLAIVDPPYGSSFDAIGMKDHDTAKAKRTKYKQFDNIAPTQKYFLELNRVSRNQIVWGGNFFGLKGGVIAWNKNGTAFGEGEVAICSTHKSVRFYEYTWNGMIQHDMKNKEHRIHPTQKPVKLYEWILKNYANEGDKILDTHLGSGSSAIACHNYGYEFVGCELDEDYFNDMVKRFKQVTAQQTLF